ncbi:hypothetical protein [Streptomyces sp. MST-110588]|uniref:hypothetical protein n=1 Tax=Streptomyces sp. MST-110588 TaxID=2833628 RepID=UPI001F5DADE9|nr:hypothetical protein [Streptomyces sp. MST-110588]UNO42099.1 hypothetical protein KGS77_24510 [Streptomyces sp. MST-110588]
MKLLRVLRLLELLGWRLGRVCLLWVWLGGVRLLGLLLTVRLLRVAVRLRRAVRLCLRWRSAVRLLRRLGVRVAGVR